MGIPRSTIKNIVKKNNIRINDNAADEIAKLLEKKASIIAKYAVNRAKKAGRKVILQEDIDSYKIKFDE